MTRYNGSNLMIDCGEGTQVAVKEKGWSFKPIDVICFTHYHADHISGLPGLLLTMGNACLLYTSLPDPVWYKYEDRRCKVRCKPALP